MSTPITGGIALSAQEARVLGCLIEKQRTTPDAYPLSLNALRLACNQSTNRDPVVEYDEATLRDALHRLERRGLSRFASGAGSRASKHRHLLAEALPTDRGEEAVMCVLLLRGAQTPGELKQRTERMHVFASLADLQEALERLIARGLAARLDRRPGQKEERYEELLSADAEQAGALTAGAGAGEPDLHADPPEPGGLAALEARVGRLEAELSELRARLGNTPDGAPLGAHPDGHTPEGTPVRAQASRQAGERVAAGDGFAP